MFIFIMVLMLTNIDIYAYSKYVIPGGESVGINIKTDGIMIVGFYKVDGTYNKGTPELKIGDKIAMVGKTSVETVKDLIKEIEENMHDNKVNLIFIRDGKTYNTTLSLKKDDANYKTGLYVKDELTGIGTVSYIDPETKIYGALGHEIMETSSNKIVDVKTGSIFKSYVTGIDRSSSGTPGYKNAKFYSNNKYGSIDKNTIKGIYGTYEEVPNKEALEVATIDEVELGTASIYTVLDGTHIEEYEIEITNIDKTNDIKNIHFYVKDERLLEKTGGIVQGMSGSPIIQNNKIIGAVTHVVVNNPKMGYGISIISMLEEGEKGN